VTGAGPSRPPEVVVYAAPACSLCEPAKRTVREVAGRLGIPVREVDISGDPELEARYREHIPVVSVDGETAFTYVVSPTLLERRLRDAQARGADRPS
jgi:glutaredoxin